MACMWRAPPVEPAATCPGDNIGFARSPVCLRITSSLGGRHSNSPHIHPILQMRKLRLSDSQNLLKSQNRAHHHYPLFFLNSQIMRNNW